MQCNKRFRYIHTKNYTLKSYLISNKRKKGNKMKVKIRDLIIYPSKEHKKELKKALKREINICYALQKFPPRFYAYKMMVKDISPQNQLL